MADLEDGLWACGTPRATNAATTPMRAPFVTAMVKGRGGAGFAIKAGDATRGRLSTQYDGARPPGYAPMKLQDSIILGIGGDNSDSAVGSFLEGAVCAGYSTDVADDELAANIVGAGYGV